MKGKKELTLTSKFLLSFFIVGEIGEIIFPSPSEFKRRTMRGNLFETYSQFRKLAYRLHKQGVIKFVDKHNERFIALTKKGELQTLLEKGMKDVKTPEQWDGKWWVVMFDIPEESREKRDHFRSLLKHNNFYYLQDSVFVSPYGFNDHAMVYLTESKLINYIRIMKVEKMDNDRDIRKHFGLI